MSSPPSDVTHRLVEAYRSMPEHKELQVSNADVEQALRVIDNGGGHRVLNAELLLSSMKKQVNDLAVHTQRENDIATLSPSRQPLARALHENQQNDLEVMRNNVDVADNMWGMAQSLIRLQTMAQPALPAAAQVKLLTHDGTDDDNKRQAVMLPSTGQLSCFSPPAQAELTKMRRHAVTVVCKVEQSHRRLAENIVRASGAIEKAVQEDGQEFSENVELRRKLDEIADKNKAIEEKLARGEDFKPIVVQLRQKLKEAKHVADDIRPNSHVGVALEDADKRWKWWQVLGVCAATVAGIGVVVLVATNPEILPILGVLLAGAAGGENNDDD